jgi:protein-S-isoprenylcysteine O-methyltransferase Ste14
MKYKIGRMIFRYRWIIYIAVFAVMALAPRSWENTQDWLTCFIIGALLAFMGAGIRIYSAFYIGWKGKPDDPLKRVLTTDGPYRYTRNPLYWGNILGFAGAAVMFKLLWYVPIAAGVIFLLHHLLITWYEEFRMRAKYGQAYEDYCQKVPRWGPKLFNLAPHDTTKVPFPMVRVFMAELGTIGGFLGSILVAIVKHLYFY